MSNNFIYVGDTFPLVVSWFIPQTDNPYVASDAIISKATVRVVKTRDRVLIVDNDQAEIDGNETRYVVPSEKTTATGSYTAYITAEFNDGNVSTKSVPFYITPKT